MGLEHELIWNHPLFMCIQDEERHIMISDEVNFPLNGRVNTQNTREYAEYGHPPLNFNVDVRNDVRGSLHCWCGLTSEGHLVGPCFYEANLNGQLYLDIINDFVVPECNRQHIAIEHYWWFQDGCPAHRTGVVRERLQELFPNQVVALGHPTEYPPRSPDLTPLDFFLWGYVKSQVYRPPFAETLPVLQERVEAALRGVGRELIIRSVRDMYRRAQLCIQLEGAQVEGRV